MKTNRGTLRFVRSVILVLALLVAVYAISGVGPSDTTPVEAAKPEKAKDSGSGGGHDDDGAKKGRGGLRWSGFD